MNDLRLARLLAQKIQRLLSPQFDYIVDQTPKAEFLLEEDSVKLDRLVFKSVETDDIIVVEENAVFWETDIGMSALLCEPEDIQSALKLTDGDLYIIDAYVMDYIEAQRRSCHDTWD